MTTKYQLQLTNGLGNVFTVFKKDVVLTTAVVLALASCVISLPKAEYIDFKVLACLFNIMIIVKAFEELHLLDRVSARILNGCSDSRKVSLVLIVLSFFSSMLFTNDVALLTLVPLALVIGAKSGLDMLVTVILQTLAANIGSSLTPMGNPQNLYIFSYYKLHVGEFFTVVGAFAVLGLVWLVLLNRRGVSIKLKVSLDLVDIKDKKLAILWGAVFFVIVLSVFNVVHYGIAFVLTALAALLMNRQLLLKVDYPLLITFIGLFISIGNLSNIPMIDTFMKNLLGSGGSTYFASILLSQAISNVPSAILLSGFTTHWRELLLGVNVGGMGTIIASLASVISYKLYIGAHPENTGKYLAKFSFYNFASLALFTFLNYLFM